MVTRKFDLGPAEDPQAVTKKAIEANEEITKESLEKSLEMQVRNLEIELFEGFKKSIEKLSL